MREYDHVIGAIYDCAANPELWPETLNRLRDFVGSAYLMVGLADFSSMQTLGHPTGTIRHSEWDPVWFDKLSKLIPIIPKHELLLRDDIDSPWVQMDYISMDEVRETQFYKEWVEPQKLKDCVVTQYMKRNNMYGVCSFATPLGAPDIDDRQRKFAAFVSPHIRRAIAINDMVDKGSLALMLYRKVLDSLAVAVVVVGASSHIRFANAKADKLLSQGNLLRKANGKLMAVRRDVSGTSLDDAIDRCTKGDAASGLSGIGVPLASETGERAAAYVLPIRGDDVRGQMGDGSATVFIAQRGEQQPMAVEILRTVFDLTPTEARIAYATSLGDSPETISLAHGTTTDTVRSHLKHIYVKADVPDKTALAARVNALVPPVTQ